MQDFLTTALNSTAIVSLVYFTAAFVLHVRRQQSAPVVIAPVEDAKIISPLTAPAVEAISQFHEKVARLQEVGRIISTTVSDDIGKLDFGASASKAAQPKAMPTAITFTVPDAELMPVVASEAIDWNLWGLRDLRWIAPRLGVKGAGI